MRARTLAALVRLVLLSAMLLPAVGSAYSFMPTELEWATWPEFCRARYVTTNIGGRTKWSREYPQAAVEIWRARLGADAFIHIHHYCAGAAYFNRSKLEGNEARREALLGQAAGEAMYTFQRIPESSPAYANVAIHLGQVHHAMGRNEEAIGFIQHAIKAQPNDARPYIGLAMLYRDMKQPEQARAALLKGDAALEGRSAEIHYHLGLLYFDLNDMDRALQYATKAYERGYPLPGLQEKLKRTGRWPD